jgi:hypothetical protein
MSKFRRKHQRRGRYAASQEAAPLLAHMPTAQGMHDALVRGGFVLAKSVRPYLRTDGLMSIRFVWRLRHQGGTTSVTYTEVLRVG